MELESSRRSTSMARRFGTSMVCSLLCSLIRSYKIRESAALIAEAVLRSTFRFRSVVKCLDHQCATRSLEAGCLALEDWLGKDRHATAA